jgi:hypothetical protein
VIEIHELSDGDAPEIGGVRIEPLRLAEDYIYAFVFDDGERRLLVAMDELDSWDPPEEAKGCDLAVVPKGLADVHPFTGERLIPEEHPALAVEARFAETLEIVAKLEAKRVVMTHVEESDGLSHDDLAELSRRLRTDGLDVEFAFDTQIVDGLAGIRQRRQVDRLQALLVGEDVHLDDPAAADRDRADGEEASLVSRDPPGGPVHEHAGDFEAELRVHARLPRDRLGAAELEARAGPLVGAEDDVRVEERDERGEVAAPPGGHERLDDLALRAPVGVAGRRAADTPPPAARELAHGVR